MEHENSSTYQGQELSLFAEAINWKLYWSSSIRGWISGDVLEVGAGIGTNTHLLQTPEVQSWHCLEPDASLCEQLRIAVADIRACSVECGTVANLSCVRYDTILYIDVLEHIEADQAELALAASLLRPGGRLIVLSPAHQFLFSRFDEAIGHYRRYDRRSLLACSPRGCRVEAMFYLDSLGVTLSFANRLLLRQSTPTPRQLRVWDRSIVPASRKLDRLLQHRIGKSIVGVWTNMQNSDEVPGKK
jgi:SAM-dependent methyltransferase